MHDDTVELVASRIAQAQHNGQYGLAADWFGFVADWYGQADLSRVARRVSQLND